MSTATQTTLHTAREGYDRDLRVAVLGVGMMGQDHARRLAQLTKGARLVAVSDVDGARTDAVAAEFGVRALHDPVAAVEDPEVDAVVIATPGFTHEGLVLKALEAGKPTLCEKPLTTSPETSRAIVEAERALGRQLVQVGFMRRFDAEYERLRAVVASQELGRPLFLHCVHRNATTPPNFSSEMLVLDSVVHEVDAARFLLGEEITAITVLRPGRTSNAPEGLQDPQFVLMETESGALVDVEIFVNTTTGYVVRTELVAERGTAQIGLGVGLVQQSRAGWGGGIPADFKERFGAAYDVEFQRWVDAVRSGAGVDGPGVWDGYAAAAVCAAGVESLRTGRRVEVDLGARV
ncbi:Gfo/Idh/MocA family oxidoreductase [Paenibacillus sp. TRM 82003]|uniref:Gfo/Idh/MocA family protein n=1 Tax=Kineococcus sp. TRM81007 TaxID=2925831 RepID=UPI001F5AE2FF|nr:Gfo/Idh/MocA family oxidoreductase [Kineococcus sp. TRM81007]MCI2237482.1 Gfo/Idh/MocA family oxidoreductase [Kineococcus sp. TRM81007]MCI3919835.1 Gfo/Idh/MocA family oxidoreductase [Paenibacillus sp. TRM 82003]